MSSPNSGDDPIPPYLDQSYKDSTSYGLDIPRLPQKSSSVAATEASQERTFNSDDGYPDDIPRGTHKQSSSVVATEADEERTFDTEALFPDSMPKRERRTSSIAATEGSDDAMKRATEKSKQDKQTSAGPTGAAEASNTTQHLKQARPKIIAIARWKKKKPTNSEDRDSQAADAGNPAK